MVLLDMQSPFPGEGKMLGLPPESARSSRNTATAWRDSGTRCSRHFHAFGRNAPHSGIFIKVLQFAPLAGAQFSRSKKRQGYQLQCKFGLLLAAVTLQLLQERWQL